MIAPYLDASAIIYLVEGSVTTRELVVRRLAGAEQDPTGRLLTSQLSRLECRAKPLRTGDMALLGTYDAFFTRARLVVAEVTAAVIDRATDLRARYRSSTRAWRVGRPKGRARSKRRRGGSNG